MVILNDKKQRKGYGNIMKFISWNVNGIRACVQKGFLDYFKETDADFFCIQETKMQAGQLSLELDGYYQYFNYAEKKGYSGTAIFTKHKPISVTYGIGIEEHDHEGRVITLEYEKGLEESKPVVVCGDLNVAHREIDLKNPKTNRKNAGFTDEEREKFQNLMDSGFIDTYRYLYPNQEGIYSWWSYRFKAREKNAGWRIDYFLVSDSLKNNIKEASIHTDIFGSDHCPVEVVLEL